MALVTNGTRQTPIGIGRVLIRPGESVEIEKWDDFKGRKSIKAMLEAGDLRVGKAAANAAAKQADKTNDPQTPAPPSPPAGGNGGPPAA